LCTLTPEVQCLTFHQNHVVWTGFVTRLTRRVSLVEQELLTLPEHLSSPPVFSGVRVTRSLILCVMSNEFHFKRLNTFAMNRCMDRWTDIFDTQQENNISPERGRQNCLPSLTIYIHCQKIYNLFVRASERDIMQAFGKFFCVCFVISAN
jgi:hypothetical protein